MIITIAVIMALVILLGWYEEYEKDKKDAQ